MRYYSSKDKFILLRFFNSFLVGLYTIMIIGADLGRPDELVFPLWFWTFIVYYISSGETGIYKTNNPRRIFGRLIEAWIWTSMVLLILLYLAKVSSQVPRLEAITWLIISISSTIILHIIFYRLVNKVSLSKGSNGKDVLVWGNKQIYDQCFEINSQFNTDRFKRVSWFCEPEQYMQTKADSNEWRGGVSELEKWLENNQPDIIKFSHDTESLEKINYLIDIFGRTSAEVYFNPLWRNESMSLKTIFNNNTSQIRLWGSSRGTIDEDMKRFLDVCMSFIFIVLGMPIFVITSIAIYFTSKGPIFFTQPRNGLNGKVFNMIKFRTMYVHKDSGDLQQASIGDARITPVGKFLRKWSIDELPQLFNVLKGDMTIVGPRPHAVQHNVKYNKLIRGYMQRHNVKPGMTGLAQVIGFRGETKTIEEMKNRVYADLVYQSNWSIKKDLGILLETVLALGTNKSY